MSVTAKVTRSGHIVGWILERSTEGQTGVKGLPLRRNGESVCIWYE